MTFSQKQGLSGGNVPASPAGQVSAAPAAQDPVQGGSGNYVTYTVRSGDTLWGIAQKYPGVTETDIARLNNITNTSKIQPGQVIRIKPK
jgi:membrane-bound lytic murein transglycosylase D